MTKKLTRFILDVNVNRVHDKKTKQKKKTGRIKQKSVNTAYISYF